MAAEVRAQYRTYQSSAWTLANWVGRSAAERPPPATPEERHPHLARSRSQPPLGLDLRQGSGPRRGRAGSPTRSYSRFQGSSIPTKSHSPASRPLPPRQTAASSTTITGPTNHTPSSSEGAAYQSSQTGPRQSKRPGGTEPPRTTCRRAFRPFNSDPTKRGCWSAPFTTRGRSNR